MSDTYAYSYHLPPVFTAGLSCEDFQGLEPCAVKVACTVLRGQRERKLPALPGTHKSAKKCKQKKKRIFWIWGKTDQNNKK